MVQKRNLSISKITTAAKQLVNEDGAEQLSFSRVADVLGVRPQAMYAYFPGKEQLKVALIIDFLDELTANIEKKLVGVAGEQALTIFGERLHTLLLAQPEMTRLAFGGINYRHQEVANEHLRELINLLEQLIAPYTANHTEMLNEARLFRALVFGYVQNELWGLFQFSPVPAQDSFEAALKQVIGTITSDS